MKRSIEAGVRLGVMKAIIFDLDGVIFDTRTLQEAALRYCYNKYKPYSEVPIKEFFELSGSRLEEIFSVLGIPLHLVNDYREYSSKHIDDIRLFDGILELLTKLKDKRVPLGICTGKDRKRTVEILNKFAINEFFRGVVCSDEVNFPKPHPESLFKCAKIMDVDIDQCIMIGDAINDIKCAKSAGMKCVAVSWGEFEAAKLIKFSPDYCVYEPMEILDVFWGQNNAKS